MDKEQHAGSLFCFKHQQSLPLGKNHNEKGIESKATGIDLRKEKIS